MYRLRLFLILIWVALACVVHADVTTIGANTEHQGLTTGQEHVPENEHVAAVNTYELVGVEGVLEAWPDNSLPERFRGARIRCVQAFDADGKPAFGTCLYYAMNEGSSSVFRYDDKNFSALIPQPEETNFIEGYVKITKFEKKAIKPKDNYIENLLKKNYADDTLSLIGGYELDDFSVQPEDGFCEKISQDHVQDQGLDLKDRFWKLLSCPKVDDRIFVSLPPVLPLTIKNGATNDLNVAQELEYIYTAYLYERMQMLHLLNIRNNDEYQKLSLVIDNRDMKDGKFIPIHSVGSFSSEEKKRTESELSLADLFDRVRENTENETLNKVLADLKKRITVDETSEIAWQHTRVVLCQAEVLSSIQQAKLSDSVLECEKLIVENELWREFIKKHLAVWWWTYLLGLTVLVGGIFVARLLVRTKTPSAEDDLLASASRYIQQAEQDDKTIPGKLTELDSGYTLYLEKSISLVEALKLLGDLRVEVEALVKASSQKVRSEEECSQIMKKIFNSSKSKKISTSLGASEISIGSLKKEISQQIRDLNALIDELRSDASWVREETLKTPVRPSEPELIIPPLSVAAEEPQYAEKFLPLLLITKREKPLIDTINGLKSLSEFFKSEFNLNPELLDQSSSWIAALSRLEQGQYVSIDYNENEVAAIKRHEPVADSLPKKEVEDLQKKISLLEEDLRTSRNCETEAKGLINELNCEREASLKVIKVLSDYREVSATLSDNLCHSLNRDKLLINDVLYHLICDYKDKDKRKNSLEKDATYAVNKLKQLPIKTVNCSIRVIVDDVYRSYLNLNDSYSTLQTSLENGRLLIAQSLPSAPELQFAMPFEITKYLLSLYQKENKLYKEEQDFCNSMLNALKENSTKGPLALGMNEEFTGINSKYVDQVKVIRNQFDRWQKFSIETGFALLVDKLILEVKSSIDALHLGAADVPVVLSSLLSKIDPQLFEKLLLNISGKVVNHTRFVQQAVVDDREYDRLRVGLLPEDYLESLHQLHLLLWLVKPTTLETDSNWTRLCLLSETILKMSQSFFGYRNKMQYERLFELEKNGMLNKFTLFWLIVRELADISGLDKSLQTLLEWEKIRKGCERLEQYYARLMQEYLDNNGEQLANISIWRKVLEQAFIGRWGHQLYRADALVHSYYANVQELHELRSVLSTLTGLFGEISQELGVNIATCVLLAQPDSAMEIRDALSSALPQTSAVCTKVAQHALHEKDFVVELKQVGLFSKALNLNLPCAVVVYKPADWP